VVHARRGGSQVAEGVGGSVELVAVGAQDAEAHVSQHAARSEMDALQGYAPTWRVSEQRHAPAEHNGHHLHDDLVQAAKSEHLPRHVASENAHVAARSELLRARKPGFDVGSNFYCGVRRKLLWVMRENDDRPDHVPP
jgi:hypothetical protein